MNHESENPHFSCIFLNMDISHIIALTSLKICMCIAEICMEERVSQNFDLGLSFCFRQCRRRHFEKNVQKSQKLPVFYQKMKTRASAEKLTHASLDKKVFSAYLKFRTCRLNIK